MLMINFMAMVRERARRLRFMLSRARGKLLSMDSLWLITAEMFTTEDRPSNLSSLLRQPDSTIFSLRL